MHEKRNFDNIRDLCGLKVRYLCEHSRGKNMIQMSIRNGMKYTQG